MPLVLNGPLKKSRLSEKVYQLLKQQIIEGQLAPGEKLNIFELADQLEVSRTPIKEAFNRLAEDGLLSIQPQRGTFVSTLTEDEIKHLFEVRLMIELWGIRRLCEASGAARLQTLSPVLRECELLFASKSEFDYVAFTERDRKFHEEVVLSAQNPLLTRVYGMIYPHVQLLRAYWGRARQRAFKSHEQHLQVVRAIEEGSVERAQDALTTHILSSRDDILGLLRAQRHPLMSGDGRDDPDSDHRVRHGGGLRPEPQHPGLRDS